PCPAKLRSLFAARCGRARRADRRLACRESRCDRENLAPRRRQCAPRQPPRADNRVPAGRGRRAGARRPERWTAFLRRPRWRGTNACRLAVAAHRGPRHSAIVVATILRARSGDARKARSCGLSRAPRTRWRRAKWPGGIAVSILRNVLHAGAGYAWDLI